jgi:hypothetical protein
MRARTYVQLGTMISLSLSHQQQSASSVAVELQAILTKSQNVAVRCSEQSAL